MATAGYKARARITGVVGVAMTDEPMSVVAASSGLVFRTTAATKDFWDPRVAVVVEEASVVVPSGYTVDYLLGTVTFAVAPVGAVTVTGSYLTKHLIPACKSYSLAMSANLLDSTVLGDAAVARTTGLKDVSGTLERLESGLEDYTTADGAPVGLEFRTDEAATRCTRCYALINATNLAGGVADLATSSVTFSGTTWANSADAVQHGDPAA
jgi:hypothetical protein